MQSYWNHRGDHVLLGAFSYDKIGDYSNAAITNAIATERDTDGDGMPDVWETNNGLDPTIGTGDNGPDGDPDGDWVSNIREYLCDTTPTNAGSLLAITGIGVETNGIRVEWQGGNAAMQFLERCTDLTFTTEPWRVIFTNNPPTAPRTNQTVNLGTTNWYWV